MLRAEATWLHGWLAKACWAVHLHAATSPPTVIPNSVGRRGDQGAVHTVVCKRATAGRGGGRYSCWRLKSDDHPRVTIAPQDCPLVLQMRYEPFSSWGACGTSQNFLTERPRADFLLFVRARAVSARFWKAMKYPLCKLLEHWARFFNPMAHRNHWPKPCILHPSWGFNL